MHHGNISLQIAQGRLALQKRIAAAKIPPSKLDETINVAAWNIREFGKVRQAIERHSQTVEQESSALLVPAEVVHPVGIFKCRTRL